MYDRIESVHVSMTSIVECDLEQTLVGWLLRFAGIGRGRNANPINVLADFFNIILLKRKVVSYIHQVSV